MTSEPTSPDQPVPVTQATICEHCGRPSIKLTLYTIPALARLFEVGRPTVRLWLRQGYMEARAWTHRGRLFRVVPASEVLRFLDYRHPWIRNLRPDSDSPFNRKAYDTWTKREAASHKGGVKGQAGLKRAREQKGSQS